jgi:hypothetical protein
MVKNIIRLYTDALLIDSSLYENMGSILFIQIRLRIFTLKILNFPIVTCKYVIFLFLFFIFVLEGVVTVRVKKREPDLTSK